MLFYTNPRLVAVLNSVLNSVLDCNSQLHLEFGQNVSLVSEIRSQHSNVCNEWHVVCSECWLRALHLYVNGTPLGLCSQLYFFMYSDSTHYILECVSIDNTI